jgi:hypothetical protein
MKVEVDFNECAKVFARENTYNQKALKKAMLILLNGAQSYEDATIIALDLLETIPEECRNHIMELRGYQKSID